MSDDLIEKIARAICVQNLISTRQPTDAATIDAYWQSFKAEARAALSAIEKSGTHVVVPKEPTDEMFANASDSPGSRMACQHVWADMLSARPPIPEGEKT